MAATATVRPHAGQALLSMAKTYPSFLETIVEVIQNAIDANPRTITVDVNMNSRRLEVTDDGDGVSVATFERALAQVGMSIKGRDKLGRFGRGLVSPLGKCQRFCFCSCPKRGATEGYREWTFESSTIADMADSVTVPVASKPWRFSRVKTDRDFVPWRTRMLVEEITNDRHITRLGLDTLCQAISDRYGVPIRKRKIDVWIYYTHADGTYEERKVEPPEFRGRALKESTYSTPESGDIVFRMFVTPMAANGRKGKVRFGEISDDSRISLTQFLKTAVGLLEDDVVKAFRSGVFEGEILGQRVKLHPSRNQFEEDDALVGLCVCISTWFAEVGSKQFKEVMTQNRERRYQRLGLRSMRVIEAFLRQPGFEDLIDMFTLGNIGDGHFPKPAVGTQPQPATSTDGGAGRKRRRKKRKKGGQRQEPQTDHPAHIPGTVAGPDGKPRTLVRSNSTGICLSPEEMPGQSCIYEWDLTKGVLKINTRHPYFAAVDRNDSGVMRYFETVAAVAISLLREDPESEYYEQQRAALDSTLQLLVFAIVNADRLSERLKSGGRTLKAVTDGEDSEE